MKKKGSDVTQGEDARLVVSGTAVTFVDIKNAAKYIPLFSRDVHFATVVSKTALNDLLSLVIKTEAKFYCHVFTAKAGDGDALKASLMESVRAVHVCSSLTHRSAGSGSASTRTRCWHRR